MIAALHKPRHQPRHTRAFASTAFALAVMAIAVPPQAAAQERQQDASVAQAYNVSGQELLTSFSGKPGNIVFSPFSIGTAMAMVLSGARGDTRAEMAAVLHHTWAGEEIDRANQRALALLNSYDRSGQPPACPRDMRLNGEQCESEPQDGRCPAQAVRIEQKCVARATTPASAKLRIANALMLVKKDKGEQPLAADYERTIRELYQGELFRDVGVAEINAWAGKKTEGKIEKLIERLDPDASHVLLNAVYFNALWAQPFAKGATRDEDFQLTAADKVRVPMMHRQGSYSIVNGEGYRAIRLPYSVDSLSMIVVRPDDVDGVEKVRERLGGDETGRLIAALAADQPEAVSLAMPRFKTTFEADLIEPFQKLGMTKVFDMSQSDLSGITGLPLGESQSAIQQIKHKAVIDVTEEGTEAAAVTAVVIGTRTASGPPPAPPFKIDRPFLFYVVDHTTSAILFQGRISDPRS